LQTNPTLISNSANDAKLVLNKHQTQIQSISLTYYQKKDNAAANTLVDKMKSFLTQEYRFTPTVPPTSWSILGNIQAMILTTQVKLCFQELDQHTHRRFTSYFNSAAEVNFIKAEIYFRALTQLTLY
jgi:hypothetical protein